MQKHYPTQVHCIHLLYELVWDYEPTCPKCKSKNILYNRRHNFNSKYGYVCNDCERTYSVTNNTIFASTKVPLVKWFTTIHLIKTFGRPPSCRRLAQLIDVSRTSAAGMIRKILADLKSENSLCERIYQHNRQFEPVWF